MTSASLASLDVPALLAKLGVAPRRITADSRRVEPGVAFGMGWLLSAFALMHLVKM